MRYEKFDMNLQVNLVRNLVKINNRWKCRFSWDFCIYIGRKWFGLWIGMRMGDGWKCWFLWGFTILCAILGFGKINWWNAWFYWVLWDFYLGALKWSWCVDNPAYRLPEKQNTCSGFWYPHSWSVGFFPFYRKSNICFVFENWTIWA